MKNQNLLKMILLFLLMILVDFFIIQGMRFITPKIFMLRIFIIFGVIFASLLTYYHLIKPKNINQFSLILSISCFIAAVTESLIIHVLIEKSDYQIINLVPAVIALLLPFVVGMIYSCSLGTAEN